VHVGVAWYASHCVQPGCTSIQAFASHQAPTMCLEHNHLSWLHGIKSNTLLLDIAVAMIAALPPDLLCRLMLLLLQLVPQAHQAASF
jgi:hypothetical protein